MTEGFLTPPSRLFRPTIASICMATLLVQCGGQDTESKSSAGEGTYSGYFTPFHSRIISRRSVTTASNSDGLSRTR